MLTAWAKKIANNSGVNSCLLTPNYSNSNVGFVNAKNGGGNDIVLGPIVSRANTNTLVTSPSSTGNSSQDGFAFGSGSTPPSENDYSVENIITALTLSASTVTSVYDSTNNKFVTYVNLTVTNTSDSTITIREIGHFARSYIASAIGQNVSSSAGDLRSFLIDRLVLDNPVTIAAGESAVIRYTNDFTLSA